MKQVEWQQGEEVSLLAAGALILRNRWRIIAWSVAGGLLALSLVFSTPLLYRASASFIPQGADPARSGLASIAGQLGVAIPTGGSQALTPEFYSRLLKSRELLTLVARDTFDIPGQRPSRVAFPDLYEIGGPSAAVREELGVKALSEIVAASVSKTTGIVEVSVATEWPAVSLRMVTTLVDAVNEFNQKMRRDQAASERRFIESRLAVSGAELRRAEDRLEAFLRTNRQFSSPQLTFTRERLQRAASLQQEIHNSLTQSHEEVRMREVRDTPVITVIDTPSVGALPEPRGRLMKVLLGIILGGIVGVVLAFAKDMTRRRRATGDGAAVEFAEAVRDLKGDFLRPVRRLRGRGTPGRADVP